MSAGKRCGTQVHMPPCEGVRRCGEHRDIHDYSVRQADGFETETKSAGVS